MKTAGTENKWHNSQQKKKEKKNSFDYSKYTFEQPCIIMKFADTHLHKILFIAKPGQVETVN